MRYVPYDYQRLATQWVLDHPRCGLFLDMGLGKSVITLTAMARLINDCEVEKVLVVAPKKVAETTWSSEAEKWDHLSALKVSRVMGSRAQREAALEADADIYVLGRDNFVWLYGRYNGILPFDVIVIDELTSFKSPGSLRFKAMKIASASVRRMVGLTGTPVPNGYIDLWAQLYCLDRGERLGKSITRFRQTYFTEVTWNHIVIRADLKKGSKEAIDKKISDICLVMQAKDYLQLPSLITHTEMITLPPKEWEAYRTFERHHYLKFVEDSLKLSDTVYATSAAALMNKLSQFANGAVYDMNGDYQFVHDEKVDRLMEIVEGANGSGVLVFYQYRHDLERIQERFARSGLRVEAYKDERTLRDWNDGKINVLLAHPASTAYGLNMQKGGHYIVWMGTGWNLELYQQANARLHRQGQEHPVIVYRLIVRGTVDERAAAAIEGKMSVQQGLLDSLKYLGKKYGKG